LPNRTGKAGLLGPNPLLLLAGAAPVIGMLGSSRTEAQPGIERIFIFKPFIFLGVFWQLKYRAKTPPKKIKKVQSKLKTFFKKDKNKIFKNFVK
jgi:hypothetical protein